MSLLNASFHLNLQTDLKFGYEVVQQELADKVKSTGKKKSLFVQIKA